MRDTVTLIWLDLFWKFFTCGAVGSTLHYGHGNLKTSFWPRSQDDDLKAFRDHAANLHREEQGEAQGSHAPCPVPTASEWVSWVNYLGFPRRFVFSYKHADLLYLVMGID